MEMIKGIDGHEYHDELVVPIIENAAHEGELINPMTEVVFHICPFNKLHESLIFCMYIYK